MADNTQLFINEWLGKQVDVDGYPKEQPYQCKDLVQKYVTECLGLPLLPQGDAWEMFKKAPDSLYLKIPNAWYRIPQKGDIMIWNPQFNYDPSVGHGYGHIAIVDSANLWSFVSCDQNWSADHVTLEKHNYTKPPVTGWLRKR